MDLVEFLRARLAEEEGEARAAQDVRSDYHAWHQVMDLRAAGMDERDALHIVTHSPARALAEVEAKRRILDEHPMGYGAVLGGPEPPVRWHYCETCQVKEEITGDWPCTTLCLLALPYASHPDYDERWRP